MGEVTGKVILDLGCSFGWFEKAVLERGCRLAAGIDRDRRELPAAARAVPGACFLQACLPELPFLENRFDLVVMWEVLEHLKPGSEVLALAAVRSVLKDGGRLFLSVPKFDLRSTIADHWWTSHPDNFQVYRDVTNLTIDSCLFLDGGQGFMLAEANGARISNNMMVGTHIKGLIGNRDVSDYVMEHNTIAFTGLGPVSFGGPRAVFKDNLVLPGADRQQAGIRHKTAVADYNLFYKLAGGDGDSGLGQPNTHSKYEAPKLRSAPPEMRSFIIMRWGEAAKAILAKNTPGKFYLQNDMPATDHFKVGDWVEVNYDGVPRKVTEATADYVAFDPPIRKLHHWWSDVIVNWKDRKDFAWDLRLADGSPGKGMASDGKDVGSSIDMTAYLKGDFDGDGKRDVPELPENYDRRR